MHLNHTFYKPGLESPDDIMETLDASPRDIHATGNVRAIVVRILIAIVAWLLTGIAEYHLWTQFSVHGAVTSWTIGCALIPIILIYIPWLLVSSYQKKMTSFNKLAKIYREGIPVTGTINTISRMIGHGQDCHCVEHSWRSPFYRFRIDYTFPYENTVKPGTIILREPSAHYLVPNQEICVLYLPEDPAQNMIFPIPEYDWFGQVVGKS